jgi:hypothetical protein
MENLSLLSDLEIYNLLTQRVQTRSCNAKDNVKYMTWTGEMDRCLTEIQD